MIKLGAAYFDEASIISIFPSTIPSKSDTPTKCFMIQTSDGQYHPWEADAEEVQRRLEEVGLIAPEVHPASPEFQPHEMKLLMGALELGYYYAAKDFSGQVYAYRDLPKKGRKCWNAASDDGQQTFRLHGEFAALSWDDEFPLIIEVALEGVPGC